MQNANASVARTHGDTAAAEPVTSAESQYSLRRRIGSTTYKVAVHFSSNSKDTLEDKLLRIIESEVRKSA